MSELCYFAFTTLYGSHYTVTHCVHVCVWGRYLWWEIVDNIAHRLSPHVFDLFDIYQIFSYKQIISTLSTRKTQNTKKIDHNFCAR